MKKIEDELQEIRTMILVAQRTNYEERSQKYVDILNRLKRVLLEIDHRKKLSLEPLKRVLVVLDQLLESGNVIIKDVESKEVWDWCTEKRKYYLEHWDTL